MGYGSGMGVDGVDDVVVMSDVVDDDGALIGGRGWWLDEWVVWQERWRRWMIIFKEGQMDDEAANDDRRVIT
jgi:hypothetical protein